MAVLQALVVVPLSKVVASLTQVALGFALMGVGMVGLTTTREFGLVLAMIGVLALGTALVTPNLSALVSLRSLHKTGTALGLKSSASSRGQFMGPLIGAVLLGWRPASPFVVGGALLGGLGVAIAGSFPMWHRKRETGPSSLSQQ